MKYSAFFFVLILVGCAGMSESMQANLGVGMVTKVVSSFDGKSEVAMQPAWVANADGGMPQFKLGFFWTESVPNTVVVLVSVVSLDDYSTILGLSFNVESQIYDLDALDVLTDLDHDRLTKVTCSAFGCSEAMVLRKSEKRFVAPLSLVRSIGLANDVKVKLGFAKTYTVGDFQADSTGNVTANDSLPQFLASIAEAY